MRLPDLLAARATLAPAATAFVDEGRQQRLTYADLDGRASRAAALLGQCGVAAGDRVAILCRNRVEFFELLFACARHRAILVPLNWRMPAAELAPLLADADPVLLVHGAEDGAVAEALTASFARVARLSLDAPADTNTPAYAARRDGIRATAACRDWPADECWYLLYTSGTTGRPKGVIYTYGMALANYVSIRQGMSITRADVTLNYLPLFHTAGINLVTLPTLFEGGTVRMLPGFDPEAVVRLLAEGALDTFFGVPAVYRQLSLHPDFARLDLGRVRLGCGGAPMPVALLERYLERGARVCNGMGMTETGPTVFLMDPAAVARKIGSVGRPQLLACVRIVDSQGRDVAAGETGEFWFAGPGVTPGYWRRPEATAAAFSADGWLRSGDIGLRDEDGYHFVVGRLKDMFISGGENVYPVEVENVLASHEAILDAAVVGRADPVWGEVGHAYVEPRPGCEVPPAQALSAFCRRHLAAYKVPKTFTVVREFPRTAAGKIQKHLLREPE